MAHNIAEIDGVEAMFVVGDRESAWHRLGQRTPDAVTWKDAMQLAHLDWPVVLKDLFSRDTNGQVAKIEAFKSVWRGNGTPACLGVVGADFHVFQNESLFDFADSLIAGSEGARYESAGALGQGETIWTLARVPQADLRIRGTHDISQSYLLMAVGHTGNLAYTAKLTSTRVVCQNTLSVALSSSGSVFKVKHTKNGDRRLQDAKVAMSGVIKDSKTLEEKLNALAERKMTKETMVAVLERLFPVNKEAEKQTRREGILTQVLERYENNDGNAIPEIRGSAYNLLNAVTEYTDHYRTARLTEGKKGLTVEKARAEAALFGTGEKLKTEALQVILQVTGPGGTWIDKPVSFDLDSVVNATV